MFFDHCGYGQYDYRVTESKVNKFSTLHKLSVKGSNFLNAFVKIVVKYALRIEC